MKKSGSLTRQISWITGIISTAVIIFTSLTFSMAYYYLVQHDTRSLLVKEAAEIIQEQLTYENSVLSYRQNPTGESLSVKLQNFNLSAIIYDTNLKPIAAFGIYQKTNYTATRTLNQALTSDKINLTTHILADNLTYETLVSPVKFGEVTRGIIVLSHPYEFINHLVQLNLIVFAFSVPLSLLFGWILSVTTIKSALTPLNKLVDYIKQVQFNTRLTKLEFKDNPGTEITSLTDAFNDMVSRIGESLDKQKNFIAHASHELKTPLTQAISSLELAESTSDPKYISQVKEDLLSLNHILDNLLSMSKISSSTAPVSPASLINIKQLVTEISELYKKSIAQKRLILKIDVPPTSTLLFPKEHFRILLSNLLSNAIKYNNHHGQIKIVWESNTLAVSDTGIGMNAEEKSHMFDRFYRGRNKTSLVKGTGLGLALVKLIVDQHQIDLKVNSAPKHGTTITLKFSP